MPGNKWVSAEGELGKVVAAKLNEGVDLIEAIFNIAKEKGIKSGNVTAIGSFNLLPWLGRLALT